MLAKKDIAILLKDELKKEQFLINVMKRGSVPCMSLVKKDTPILILIILLRNKADVDLGNEQGYLKSLPKLA